MPQTTDTQKKAHDRMAVRRLVGHGMCLIDTRQQPTSELYDARHQAFDIVDILPIATLAEIRQNMHGSPVLHFLQSDSGLTVVAVRFRT